MKEILINNIYNENPGAYANEGTNIVHEIINLFKAENGKHYIYIVSDGTIGCEHNDNISDILLTRSVGDKTVEIIAWVKNPIQLVKQVKGKNKHENRKELCKQQIKYIDNIRYGKDKIRIDDIFKYSDNTYHGEKEKNVIYATFEANEVIKPKEPLFLTYKYENMKHPNTYFIDGKLNNQRQRLFINEKDSDNFNTLKKLFISNFWEDKDTFKTVDVDKYVTNDIRKDENFNFLKLIHHEYYEPAFSNLFQYYFLKNKKIFKKFAKEVLDVDIDIESEDFEIKREEYNIDILIRDNKNIIVIENKIKSGINGIKYDDYGNIVQNQLCKYYNYATGKEKSKKVKQNENKKSRHDDDKKRKPHFFIFAPNYKHLDSSKFDKAKFYKIINYSEIYEFYNKDSIKDSFKDDKYFEDFLNALYKHTLTVDSELEEKMLNRFVSAIQKASKSLNEIKNI